MFVGRRFVRENAFIATDGGIGIGGVDPEDNSIRNIDSFLDMKEYAGSLRWNFGTGSVQPFAKVGCGWARYRLENVTVGNVPLPTPNSDRINNFVWHWGPWLEWVPVRSHTPPPGGIDVGLRLDPTDYRHGLGLSQIADPIDLALGNAASDTGVKRPSALLAITIGF